VGCAVAFGMVLRLDQEYAARHTALHSAEPDFNYLAFYGSRMLCDRLLGEYHALDIGCGTCGSYRLMPGCKSIAGVDINPHMIEKAAKSCAEYGIEFQGHAGTFETFIPDRKFDFIRMGIYGSYVPHTREILLRARDMMSTRGLILTSFLPGSRYDEIRKSLSMIRRYETTRISRPAMMELFRMTGLRMIMEIKRSGSMRTYIIAGRPDSTGG
jgi:predicted TPR repeat methyltransferase